jgi:putative membrane protein
LGAADFFRPDARAKVAQAVKEIERGTSAEVVVSVRKTYGHYRHVDVYAGMGLALAMLLFLLFDPREYALEWIPLNVIVAFVLGAALTAGVTTLRRALTSRSLLRENVRRAARAAFYDLGILRTTGRTGILVYVSIFELRVEVVPDIAVKPEAIGPEWLRATQALERAVRQGFDFEAFIEALRSLAAPLARALPIQADDVNELPDEPVMA